MPLKTIQQLRKVEVMIEYTIFVVDDEKTIREGITSDIEDDYRTLAFENAELALKEAALQMPDLVLLDIGLPGMNGIQALAEFKALDSDVLVIMITAYEDIKSVIACMKTGAYDYIIKPIHMEGLEVTIANALETIRLRKELKLLQEKQIRDCLPCFIGESQIIHEIMDYIEQVAKSPDTPILIQGDTGTGKELIASTIHHRSPNFKGPFVPVNCAAIPKDLFESELFGYEKGAFSGANSSGKTGLIEMATDGTLFLDEIGELSLDAQAKLLRFMEEGEFYKIGSAVKRNVSTRIVTATNRNLETMIHEETFRKDLFFRIGVIKIDVPSLNARGEDVVLFANYFLQMFNEKFGRSITGIEIKAVELLKRYTWSGNVRELRNMMERAVLTAKSEILSVQDLGLENVKLGHVVEDAKSLNLIPLPLAGIDLDSLRDTIDMFYFKEAMTLTKGNESKAAKLLHLKHHTFRYRYKKLMEELSAENNI